MWFSVLAPVLYIGLPTLVVPITSVLICRGIIKQRKLTTRTFPSIVSKWTNVVTVQVLFISIITFLTNALHITRNIIYTFSESEFTGTHNYVKSITFFIISDCTSFMIVCNASINFFLFIFGSNFRKGLKRVFISIRDAID